MSTTSKVKANGRGATLAVEMSVCLRGFEGLTIPSPFPAPLLFLILSCPSTYLNSKGLDPESVMDCYRTDFCVTVLTELS